MKPFTYVLPQTLAEASASAKQPDTVLKGAGIALQAALSQPRQVRDVRGHISLRSRSQPHPRLGCGQNRSKFLGDGRVGRAQ